jgi:hypothetical protein
MVPLMSRRDPFVSFVHLLRDSEKEAAEHSSKRRKIVNQSPAASQTRTPANSQTQTLGSQSSFADVLQRLKEESGEGTGALYCNYAG